MFFFGIVTEAGVKLSQFEPAFLVFGFVPHSAMRYVQVDPGVEAIPRFGVEFDVLMSFPEHLDQGACRGVPLHGAEHIQIALGPGAPGESHQVEVGAILSPTRIAFFQGHYAFDGLVLFVVASDAEFVEHGLDLGGIGERSCRTAPWCDLGRGALGGLDHLNRRGLVEVFVTTVAGHPLAGHSNHPTPHQRHRGAVLVERLYRQRCVGRCGEAERAVILDGHRSENPLDVPTGFEPDRFVPAAAHITVVVGENAEFLDLSARYAFQTAPAVDIRAEYRRRRAGDCAVGD